jgi:hypothetical protein
VNNVLSLGSGTRDGSNPSEKYQSSAAMSDAAGILFLPVSTDQPLDREFGEGSTIDVNDDSNEDEDELKIKMEEVLISESKMDDSDEEAEDGKSTDKDLPVGDDDAETIKSGRDYRHGQTDWEHIMGFRTTSLKAFCNPWLCSNGPEWELSRSITAPSYGALTVASTTLWRWLSSQAPILRTTSFGCLQLEMWLAGKRVMHTICGVRWP